MNPDSAPALQLPAAPEWSHIVGLGGKAFILGAVVFFLLSIFGWWKGEDENPKLAKLGRWGFWLGCFSLFGAFASLASLFLGHQFQYEYVYNHAEAEQPTKYLIAAIWSGQQGSFLLWACTSAIFGLLAAPRTGIYRRWFTIPYAAFLASIAAILAYETPFNVIPEAIQKGVTLLPPTGAGLNASLQNYWVVIHPPTIFFGFGSLTVLFCWAISAMLSKNVTLWVRMVRPWALASLAILGLGLCMGGFWAYETLNWGGFWAWDPVENVSFVPWVFTAAFIHGLIVQAARGRYVASNLLLGGLPFLLFVYGTFLTRSGFLGDSSVHSFAEMNRVALWILLSFLGIGAAVFLGYWFKRGRALGRDVEKAAPESGVNRESLYRTGILLLTGIAAATAFGMSAPVFSLLVNGRNSRPEEWLYHQVLSWFYIPTIVLIGLAPFAAWRNMTWKALLGRVLNIITLSIGFTGFVLMAFKHPDWGLLVDQSRTTLIAFKVEVPTIYWISFLIFLTLFAGIANLWRMVETFRKSPMSLGGFVAHVGIAVFMAGMILSRGLETNEQLLLRKSVPAQSQKMGYTFTLAQNPDPDKLQDRDNKLVIDVTGPDKSFVANPTLYYRENGNGENAWTSWPHIQRFASHDVYIAIGAPQMSYWKKPESFKPGETRVVDDVKVTFHNSEMKGQPGQPGTKFIGHFTLEYKNEAGDVFTHDVSPTLELTDKGMLPDLPVAGIFRAALYGINPADKSANMQLYWSEAVYPIDLYYKPMTSLVWGGAGILTLGGLMAAFYRRVRRASPERGVEDRQEEGVPSPPNKDALIPVS